MNWKLFLDDLRDPPFSGFVIARSTSEAKQLVVEKGPPSSMSLDHDLGGDDTAMVFLKWLSENYFDSPPGFQVHSANPVGADNIVSFMNSWWAAACFFHKG
jgi:hypothetical protein